MSGRHLPRRATPLRPTATKAACALLLAALLSLPFAEPSGAQAPSEFYKGKTVTLLGGGMVAQHLVTSLGQYIPGAPRVELKTQNGWNAGELFFNGARDGSQFGFVSGREVIYQLLNIPVKYDVLKFGWIGTAQARTTVCVSSDTSPVKTLRDALGKELLMATHETHSDETIVLRAANVMVGTKFKIVTGIPFPHDAVRDGLVAGRCSLWEGFRPLGKLGEKFNVLFQIGGRPHPELPNVPFLQDFAKAQVDKDALQMLALPLILSDAYAVPPGVPAERLQALRTAFQRTLQDRQFLAAFNKQHSSFWDVQHIGGDEIQNILEAIYSMPEESIARFRKLYML